MDRLARSCCTRHHMLELLAPAVHFSNGSCPVPLEHLTHPPSCCLSPKQAWRCRRMASTGSAARGGYRGRAARHGQPMWARCWSPMATGGGEPGGPGALGAAGKEATGLVRLDTGLARPWLLLCRLHCCSLALLAGAAYAWLPSSPPPACRFDTCHMSVADVQILSNASVSSGEGVYWMFYSGGSFETVQLPAGLSQVRDGLAVWGCCPAAASVATASLGSGLGQAKWSSLLLTRPPHGNPSHARLLPS